MENNDLKKSGFITAAELRDKNMGDIIDLTCDDSDDFIYDSTSDSTYINPWEDEGIDLNHDCTLCWKCGYCATHCCICSNIY